MKTIANTLGVARSNLIEHVQRPPRRRSAYRKADDTWLLPLIRAIVDERPTYGYRRVGAGTAEPPGGCARQAAGES